MVMLLRVEPREASAALLSKARAARVGHRADCAETKWSLREEEGTQVGSGWWEPRNGLK